MDKLTQMFEKFMEKMMRFFENEQTAIKNYVITEDTNFYITEVRAITFINSGTSTCTIDKIDITYDSSLSYSSDINKTITQNFNITFASGGINKLVITTIK